MDISLSDLIINMRFDKQYLCRHFLKNNEELKKLCHYWNHHKVVASTAQYFPRELDIHNLPQLTHDPQGRLQRVTKAENSSTSESCIYPPALSTFSSHVNQSSPSPRCLGTVPPLVFPNNMLLSINSILLSAKIFRYCNSHLNFSYSRKHNLGGQL